MKTLLYPGTILLTTALLTGCGTSQPANSGTTASNSSNAAVSAKPNTNNTAASTAATNSNAPAPTAKPFTKTVEMHGIKFLVESPNSATGNTVTIKPSGLSTSNEPVKRDVNGEVTEAEVGDLNIDGSPEVYIYVKKMGAEKGTDLVAYATNAKKSMSEAYLAPPDPNSPDFIGFKGEDEFAVVESSLVRRFPVYDGSGPDAKKTGKTRQIQYNLKPGEATWQITKDKVAEY